jgi:hypothetical protein
MNCLIISLSIITAIGSIALVIVTCLYLNETRRMRDIAALALKVDSSPKVFISAMFPYQPLDESNKRLIMYTKFVIKNTGNTEARNINIKYKIIKDEQVQVFKELKETPYIFPTQEIAFDSIPIFIELNDKEIQTSKEQIKNGEDILFPRGAKPKLEMEIEISYRGFKDEPQRIPYLCEYQWDSCKWVIMVPPKKEEPSYER